MDAKILNEICKIPASIEFDVLKCTQKDKVCKIRLKAAREAKPDERILTAFKNLDCVYGVFTCSFKMSKKEANCSYYQISFVLKMQYFDGNIDLESKSAVFMKFIWGNNLTSLEQFIQKTLPYIVNMNRYIHQIKNREEKKYLYSLKKSYIKFLLYKNYIEKIYEQNSYCNDELYLFVTKSGESLHLRRYPCQDMVYNFSEVPRENMDEVYQKKEYSGCIVDMEFKEHLYMLSLVNNDFYIKATEIV